jgi:glycerol uptake facilitator-like aquaporin
MANTNTLSRSLVVEFLGTALLIGAQIGTGYALTGFTQVGIPQMVTFGIAIVSAFALAIAITVGGPISGGHFNPAVTIALTLTKNAPVGHAIPYIVAQLAGGFVAAVVANLLWAGTVITTKAGVAPFANQLASELLATSVLVGLVVAMVRRNGGQGLNWLVPSWVGIAIFLTPTGCMANPAVTFGHMFTDSLTGVAPEAVPSYIGIQILAALAVAGATILLAPKVAAKKAASKKAAPKK